MIYRLIEDQPTQQQALSPVAEVTRFPARQAVNLAATAVGLPGSALSILNDLIAAPIASKITGQPRVPYEQTPIGKILPTIEQHRGALQKLSPELLSPRDSTEQFIDTVIEDAALLAFPGAKGAQALKQFKSILKPLGVSIGANIAGSTVEGLTASKEKGALAKIGSMFGLSLISPKTAAKHVGELYKKAEAAIPEGAKVSAKPLENSLHNLIERVGRGTMAPSEKFVFDEAQAVLGKIRDGSISPLEAWAAKRSLNEKLSNLVYSSADKAANARARKLATTINIGLDKTLADYGKTNPQFFDYYKPANEAFGTLARSNFVSQLAAKHLPGNAQRVLSPLFGLGPGPGIVGSIGGAALGLPGAHGLGAAEAGYYGVKYLYRMAKDPTLRKFYLDAMGSAAKNDIPAFIKASEKLADGLQEPPAKQKWVLLD